MFLDFLMNYRTEDDGANSTAGASDGGKAEPSWIETLDEDTRTRVEEYAAAQAATLKSTLDKVRDEKTALAKQIKQIASKPIDATQYETRIKDLASKVAEAETRASFAIGAAERGIPAGKIDKVFKIARIDDLIADDGVDWDKLQADYPEFFPAVEEKKPARANAGTGRGATPQKVETTKDKMNSIIRNRGR